MPRRSDAGPDGRVSKKDTRHGCSQGCEADHFKAGRSACRSARARIHGWKPSALNCSTSLRSFSRLKRNTTSPFPSMRTSLRLLHSKRSAKSPMPSASSSQSRREAFRGRHDPRPSPRDDAGVDLDLDRLRHDVRRHVHGDPRRAGGRHVAADDPARARYRPRSDELDPDRLFDRGNHRHPAHRIPDANADHAMAVRQSPSRSSRLRRSPAPPAAAFHR